jgi:hypothetical protein
MSIDEQEHLSDEETRTYRSLAQGPSAPDGLERRVVRALRREGLIRPPLWRRTAPWALSALAGALLFVAGRSSAPPAAAPTAAEGARFVLFLEEPVAAPLAAEREPERVREYSRWARARHADGSLLEGEKLKDDAVLLRAPAAAEGPSRTTGYFVVTATDLESAVALARTCPHLRNGGDIEVRPIDPVR